MNISGYRPWQYHTQTFKVEFVTRKTCKDQKLLAERHLSSCWASSSQQIMLKQNMAQLRLCFVENYWTKTLHGLCCAHLRSGRDLSQLHRERSASAKLPAAVPPLSWWSSIAVAKPWDAHRIKMIKQSLQKRHSFSCFFSKPQHGPQLLSSHFLSSPFSHPRCRADSNCAAFFRGVD